jgi:hypothetical protein
MFVAKGELKNTGQLLRIRLRNMKQRGLRFFAIIAGIIFLASLTQTVIWLLEKSDGITVYTWDNKSIWIAIGLLAGILVMNCSYRQVNENFKVFPQTNTSRFLSHQALIHIGIIFIALFCMTLYMIQYGMVAAMALVNKNINIVFTFDIGFVLTGFVVMIIYTSIINGIISVIFTLIRRFRFYAIVFFTGIVVWMLTNIRETLELLKILFGFLIFEHGVTMFIIKGVIMWAVLLLLSIFINKYTAYYRHPSKDTNSRAAIAVVVLSSLALLSMTTLFIAVPESGVGIDNEQEMKQNVPGYFDIEPQTEVVDVSHLPPGSKINIVTSNVIDSFDYSYGTGYNQGIFKNYSDDPRYKDKDGLLMYVGYNERELSNLNGETLVISYLYKMETIDNLDIVSLANPHLSVRLEGDTLYLDFTYEENVKVVFMESWSFMRQFDIYMNKNLFKGSSAGWSMGGGISVQVERAEQAEE